MSRRGRRWKGLHLREKRRIDVHDGCGPAWEVISSILHLRRLECVWNKLRSWIGSALTTMWMICTHRRLRDFSIPSFHYSQWTYHALTPNMPPTSGRARTTIHAIRLGDRESRSRPLRIGPRNFLSRLVVLFCVFVVFGFRYLSKAWSIAVPVFLHLFFWSTFGTEMVAGYLYFNRNGP
jgi:hypothetical protein